MQYFQVKGGNKLQGTVNIPGAKNAALPMICAALLTPERCEFEDVPNISDIHKLCDMFEEIGVEVERDFENNRLAITAKNPDPSKLAQCEEAKKFRSSILMLGPMLARCGEAKIQKPGGCVIGARPNFIHTDGLSLLGADIEETDEALTGSFKSKNFANKRILLPEASVTGTENLAMFMAGIPDSGEIFFCAAEAHVCGVLTMLQEMGAKIDGIGSHHLKIEGSKNLKGGCFRIPPDGILVGTYAVAGLITQGELLINNVNHRELYSFYGLLKRMNANFEMEENQLRVLPSPNLEAIPKVQTAIFPGFSTDLQSPVGVLLTQCKGETMIFETLFENRFTYLHELEKMNAQIQILNSHQAIIKGKTQLTGAAVQSWDLRAGAAMVLAGLIADGETQVSNIDYIDRGYENFQENLTALGANINRIEV